MEPLNQINCFEINKKIWKIIGLWPADDTWKYHHIFSKILIAVLILLFDALLTLNLCCMTKQLDVIIENTLFYFTAVVVASKVITFLKERDGLIDIFNSLESEMFQLCNDMEVKILKKANSFNIMYWKIVAIVSFTSHVAHFGVPVMLHFIFSVDLELPICSYSFLSKDFIDTYRHLLYLYQCLGIQYLVLVNLNIDTFILGLIIFVIAQLDILDLKLRTLTDHKTDEDNVDDVSEADMLKKLHQCVQHFEEISKFCDQIQRVFSFIIFVQFSMASCIICICLFRFTMPASTSYYIFLATYMSVMILQILVPSWFGSKMMHKSQLLPFAVYSCDWIPRSRRFKSSLRLFVERANVPLCIVGGKMFILSLTTFTSIMNSAYSFFTLLRNIQTR
ncbi:odorant receptor 46a isoform X2 [Galleria mellonella]|uniref:Odorant receptor n=1 Tax=Galleria mellonella TaxID=7137 RepID=A0A6J1X0L5_GALME|nr:odorant receptor 46a isoform X2 [Galleria mellonella]